MRLFPPILLLLSATPLAALDVLAWFSAELRQAGAELREVERSMLTPRLPAAQPDALGFKSYAVTSAPLEPPWVQVDLGAVREVDQIVIIPAATLQDGRLVPDAFPRRFRVDVADDAAFSSPRLLLDHTREDVPARGVEPWGIATGGAALRCIRITVPGLASNGAGRLQFALGELLVLRGNRNLAAGARVTASDDRELPPAWRMEHLVDGKSALGPPVDWSVRPTWTQNGLTASGSTAQAPRMLIDLGHPTRIDEVRLHGMTSSVFDSPDLRFPAWLRVECAVTPDMREAILLFESSRKEPIVTGGNPVFIPVQGVVARYIQIQGRAAQEQQKFGLAEIQVFSGDVNVARDKPVQVLPTKTGADRTEATLVDERITTGALLDLPLWLVQWQKWSALRDRAATLKQQIALHRVTAVTRATWTAVLIALALIGGFVIMLLRMRQRRRADLSALRDRIARDLHDEIGSSLAGLAMLGESAAAAPHLDDEQRADWQEVRRTAIETSQAMREALWLIGARQEAGGDLFQTMRHTAERLLRGHSLVFEAGDNTPSLPAEHQRQLMLAYKEALTNIVRHAPGAEVQIRLQSTPHLEITITDKGPGFDPQAPSAGLGLANIRTRLQALQGTVDLQTSSAGTTLTFRLLNPKA